MIEGICGLKGLCEGGKEDCKEDWQKKGYVGWKVAQETFRAYSIGPQGLPKAQAHSKGWQGEIEGYAAKGPGHVAIEGAKEKEEVFEGPLWKEPNKVPQALGDQLLKLPRQDYEVHNSQDDCAGKEGKYGLEGW